QLLVAFLLLGFQVELRGLDGAFAPVRLDAAALRQQVHQLPVLLQHLVEAGKRNAAVAGDVAKGVLVDVDVGIFVAVIVIVIVVVAIVIVVVVVIFVVVDVVAIVVVFDVVVVDVVAAVLVLVLVLVAVVVVTADVQVGVDVVVLEVGGVAVAALGGHGVQSPIAFLVDSAACSCRRASFLTARIKAGFLRIFIARVSVLSASRTS